MTGLLLALNLPAIPDALWLAPLGSAIAIIVVKQFFGGIGHNFANPAIVGRIVLMMSFAGIMAQWPAPLTWLKSADAVAISTPLSGGEMPNVTNLLLGVRGGCLGETCAAALVIGLIYLCIRRVITPLIPLVFCGTTVLSCWAFSGFDANPLDILLSGGLLLGSIFMATDYVTSPSTRGGKIIFAIGCGLITALIRSFGSLPEGVSFSILVMNILSPLLDNIFKTKPFGAKKKEACK